MPRPLRLLPSPRSYSDTSTGVYNEIQVLISYLSISLDVDVSSSSK